jgi:NhaC family Na+:H+ antiporter
MTSVSNSGDSISKNARIPLLLALFPIVVLIFFLGINVYLYGEDSSYGPNQIALLLAAAAAAVTGMFLKVPFKDMIKGVEKAIGSAMAAMLILLLIGSLAGTWMMSGIVPAMIYHGLDILNPQIFLFASAIVCAVVSVATGSSWSTVATVGLALLGIGTALGIGLPLTAGAIISGAYFGDKISPLSDTTNLAAAMAETELIGHIKYMLWTTIPSFVIACGIYLAIGYGAESAVTTDTTAALKTEVASHFNTLSPVLFLVPLAVLAMVMMKVDAIPALFVGAVLGGLFAVIFQPKMITEISGLEKTDSYLKQSYVAFTNSMAFETKGISDKAVEPFQKELAAKRLAAAREQTGNPDLTAEEFADQKIRLEKSFPELEAKVSAAKLLKGKGMTGMLNTIWLILTAMSFGGVMEATGLLRRLTEPLIGLAKSDGSLVATTAGTCLFVNATASDQYLSIVVPGRMFRETYEERGLAPQNLSRTLEDSGTVTSVLIPWNTCGAAQSSVLNVGTLAYAPFCFFNWISPLMTLFIGFTGIGVKKLSDVEQADSGDN